MQAVGLVAGGSARAGRAPGERGCRAQPRREARDVKWHHATTPCSVLDGDPGGAAIQLTHL